MLTHRNHILIPCEDDTRIPATCVPPLPLQVLRWEQVGRVQVVGIELELWKLYSIDNQRVSLVNAKDKGSMMGIKKNPLELPPTAVQLKQLAEKGVLKARALERGLKIINHTPDREKWERFLSVLLLLLGAGFTVSGIFFFFAFNWASMHHFFKLGLLEVTMLIAIGLTFWRGLDKLSGKVALGASGLIVGALIAVFGQVYQTGADSYQLFLTWALLITGWVLISKYTPLWFLWVLLFNLGLTFYCVQIIGTIDGQLYLWLFLLNGGAILAWEIVHARDVEWLKSRWPPRLLSLPAFVVLVAPTMTLIFSSIRVRHDGPWLYLMGVLFVVVSLLVLYMYSQKILDQFMLTICALSLIIVVNSWIVHVGETLDELLLFLLSGLFIGQAALVVTWLRKVSKSWEARKS